MPRLPALVSGDVALYKTVLANGILGFGTNTPPSAVNGDCYIIGTSPTGAWVGSANKIAIYNGSSWDYIPTTGAIGTNERNLVAAQNGGGETYRWFGSEWIKYAAPTTVNGFTYSYDPYPQYATRDELGSGGGGATDLGYTASTRLLTSSTGTDVTLPLVSSTDAGLAPASGGGTSNFLRADGTWAAPGGGTDTPVTRNTLAASTTIAAGFSAYIPQFAEIGDTFTLEIGSGSYLEIG